MTNDELLAGFLDSSLSPEQLQEFEARKAADPSFADEVDNMTTVEELLAKTESNATAPIGFLSSVEASVLAKIALVSAGAAGIGYTLSNLWMWVVGASVAVVGGGAVYIVMNSATKNPADSNPVQHPTINKHIESPQIQSPLAEPTTQEKANTVSNPQSQQNRLHSKPEQEHVQQADQSATAEANSPSSTLMSLENDYARCAEGGRSVQCAQIALQIGQVYQQKGNTAKALEFFNAAYDHAKKTRIVQYQVKALGALGLVAAEANNHSEARRYLNEAIELAKANGIDAEQYVEALRKVR